MELPSLQPKDTCGVVSPRGCAGGGVAASGGLLEHNGMPFTWSSRSLTEPGCSARGPQDSRPFAAGASGRLCGDLAVSAAQSRIGPCEQSYSCSVALPADRVTQSCFSPEASPFPSTVAPQDPPWGCPVTLAAERAFSWEEKQLAVGLPVLSAAPGTQRGGLCDQHSA